MTRLEEAIDKAEAWLEIEGVQGVAESEKDGESVILVHLFLPDAARKIPATWMGFPVVTELSEPFQAQQGGPEDL